MTGTGIAWATPRTAGNGRLDDGAWCTGTGDASTDVISVSALLTDAASGLPIEPAPAGRARDA